MAQKGERKTPEEVSDQQFPNSWIATTAPIALGMLTDLVTEFAVYRGDDGREVLWPLIFAIYRIWLVGHSTDSSDVRWVPCEALTRIVCDALFQLPKRLFVDVDICDFPRTEQMAWVSTVVCSFRDLLSSSITLQQSLRTALLDSKDPQSVSPSVDDMSFDVIDPKITTVQTAYGQGKVKSVVDKLYKQASLTVSTSVIELEFGATLYQPSTKEVALDGTTVDGIPSEVDSKLWDFDIVSSLTRLKVPDAYWVSLVPALKIRCVAAHCLHETLDNMVNSLVPMCTFEDIEGLLAVLESSRRLAASTVKNESVSMAFRESLLKEWGDGVGMPDESSETTARLALLHGSDVFFLTQEAGSAKAYIHILSLLYTSNNGPSDSTRSDFSEPLLIPFMVDVLDNFLLSEQRDGHLIDPNIWRRAIEGQGKVALYCTTFAPTIVEILKVIYELLPEQFERHKHVLYPRICALVRVQSEEIRIMVQDVLVTHVAVSMGVHVSSSSSNSSHF